MNSNICRKYRTIFITILLLLINTMLIIYFYSPGIRPQATLEPADKAFLYPGQWTLDKIVYSGDGKIQFEIIGFKNGDCLQKFTNQDSSIHMDKGQDVSNQTIRVEETLAPGNTKFLVSRAGLSKSMVFSYYPAKRYKEGGNNNYPHGVMVLTRNELLVAGRSRKPEDWFASKQGSKNKVELDIPDELDHKVDFDSLAGAELIWLNNRRGIPADSMNRATAYKQTEMLNDNISKGWCSNIAESTVVIGKMYGYNLRYLGSGGTIGKEVKIGGHAFNEVYWTSSGTWQLVDLTLKILKITDQTGKPLNTLEFADYMKETGNRDSLGFYIWNDQQENFIKQKWSQLDSETKESLQLYYGQEQQFYYYGSGSGLYAQPNRLDTLRRHMFSTERYIYCPDNLSYALSLYDLRKILLWGNVLLIVLIAGCYLRARRRAHLDTETEVENLS